VNVLSVLVNGSMSTSIPIAATVAPVTIELSYESVGVIGRFKMPALSVQPGSGVILTNLKGVMVVSDEEVSTFQNVRELILTQA